MYFYNIGEIVSIWLVVKRVINRCISTFIYSISIERIFFTLLIGLVWPVRNTGLMNFIVMRKIDQMIEIGKRV